MSYSHGKFEKRQNYTFANYVEEIMQFTESTIEQLEYPQILCKVQTLTKGEGGRQLLGELLMPKDLAELRGRLMPVQDLTVMISEGELFDLYPYDDITEDIYMLSKNGYVLESEAVIRLAKVLQDYQMFQDHFDSSRKKNYPHIYALGVVEDYDELPLQWIRRVFDPEGHIKPDASPELKKIHQRIASTNKALNKRFDEVLAHHKKGQLLNDTAESIRNGRRVLVLPVENKRKISGVLHDQSASGKTVYIEPQELLELNNELYSLDNDLRAEMYRILRELSEQLRRSGPMIQHCFERVTQIDAARSKAIFSLEIEGVMPELQEGAGLSLIGARHPLLMLKEREGHPKTISFDVDLRGSNRLLLISGPNAGGKSVTLKAVGLLHLMLYQGILIPVDEKSKVGVFQKIYTDIGDQQSIDAGLSTYSSHLKNLKEILDAADDKTLILLDEIGSGTDPKLGGAIAEGIIRGLIAKKCIGIITTHYSELKVFAFRQNGIVNGAMLFDKEHLQPTYKLKVGKPGSSYAFEVAKKVELDERAIRYARKKVGKKENQIEDLLVDLQEGKAVLDEQLQWLEEERARLDKLVKNYETLAQEFQVKRKKLQIRSKELELKKANDENVELQQLINKLEKEKNLEELKKRKKQNIERRSQESSQISDLKRSVIAKKKEDEVIVVGDFVKMLDGDMSGEVLSINGDRAKVLFGIMPMIVSLADVTLANEHLKINAHKRVDTKGVSFNHNFSPKLDIRGYTLSDASETLQLFFDQALLTSARTLEIVHGKGSGALRKLVIRKMMEYKDFTSYHHAAEEYGGNGVTFIKM